MKKKMIISVFGVAICLGAMMSLVNLKSVKSLVDMNIEALTYSWDGIQLQYHFDSSDYNGLPNGLSKGTCGFVGNGTLWGSTNITGLMAICGISFSSVQSLQSNPYFSTLNWCCESCPSTTYCN